MYNTTQYFSGSHTSSAGSSRKGSRRSSSTRLTKSREGGQSVVSAQASEPAVPHPLREDDYGIPMLQLSSSDVSVEGDEFGLWSLWGEVTPVQIISLKFVFRCVI